MHEPAAVTLADTVVAFARWSDAVDALCSAIAGFALLANTRAFTFTALLAWREPVLGGVGLVLLAALGWLRWQCGGRAAAHDTHAERVTRAGRVTHAAHALPVGADRALVACYNRSSESESKRRAARVGPRSSSNAWPHAGAQVKRPQRSLCVIRT
ncbi:hypothetical protein NDK50_25260 [Paraburkholderia bryophila]|uniref:hypothetical protein n=1 Tax=Paraburkholderia bryophila TaxID=420952 RepID=UPI00234B72FD|nr:hypothetical protein [Paraburkholderia bryophila]WCM24143.1 hypothetical protein NDK50_25260 [Paraburkholderia bryophila]